MDMVPTREMKLIKVTKYELKNRSDRRHMLRASDKERYREREYLDRDCGGETRRRRGRRDSDLLVCKGACRT